MNKSFRSAALATAFLATAVFSSGASAAYVFSDSNGGDAFLSGTYPAFTLNSADNDIGASLATYTETFTATQTVSFTWNYVSNDTDGGFYDPAGYYLNGSLNQLSDNGYSASGSTSLVVNAGDTFGWYANSLDTVEGRGVLTVNVTSAVPEPENMMLVLAGLGALGLVARRRKSA